MNAVEEKTEFEFDELSDQAKERTRDKFREHHLEHGWWEHVYDDAATTARLFGLHIDSRADGWDIRFNGFYTQGSGACWSGEIHTAELDGAVERVKAFAPNDTELILMAQLAEKLYAEIAAVHAFNRLCDDDTNRDWPDVELGMRLQVKGNERNWRTSIDGSDVSNDIEKIADELVDDFGSWIHSQLEAEHDYQMDDEQIDEAIEAAGLSFDEHGNAL